MENSYKLGELELAIYGTENEREVREMCNLILDFGRLYNKKGTYNEKMYKVLLNEIKEDKENWEKIENMLLNHIEDYMKNGVNNQHNMEHNDICIGTLKLMDIIYSAAKDEDYLQHNRLQNDIAKMEKLSRATFEAENRKPRKKHNNKSYRMEDEEYFDGKPTEELVER